VAGSPVNLAFVDVFNQWKVSGSPKSCNATIGPKSSPPTRFPFGQSVGARKRGKPASRGKKEPRYA
jgi:hypothetical protein